MHTPTKSLQLMYIRLRYLNDESIGSRFVYIHMTPDPEFQKVYDASPERKLATFRRYCEDLIERKDEGDLSIEEAAYIICGTGFHALEIQGERQNIVSDILDLACDLELPPGQRMAKSNWEDLVKKVRELPEI